MNDKYVAVDDPRHCRILLLCDVSDTEHALAVSESLRAGYEVHVHLLNSASTELPEGLELLGKRLRNYEAAVVIASEKSELLQSSKQIHNERPVHLIQVVAEAAARSAVPCVVVVGDLPIETRSRLDLDGVNRLLIEWDQTREDLVHGVVIALERLFGTARFGQHWLERARAQADRAQVQQKIDESAPDFVKQAQEGLKKSASKLEGKGQTWLGIGAGLLGLAVVLSGILLGMALLGSGAGADTSAGTLIGLGLKSALVLALALAMAKYCRQIGESFMNQAIVAKHRANALSFGLFFLQAYGADAERSEILEVFQGWTEDSVAEFSRRSDGSDATKFDPEFLTKIESIVKAIKS